MRFRMSSSLSCNLKTREEPARNGDSGHALSTSCRSSNSIPLNWHRIAQPIISPPTRAPISPLVDPLLSSPCLQQSASCPSCPSMSALQEQFWREISETREERNRSSGGSSPGPNPHTALYPHHTHLVHNLMRLSHHLHHLIPRPLHGRASRMHGVRQPRSLEELLHFSDLFGYRKSSCADLNVYRVNWAKFLV